jgi:16S rRNA (cytosine967-C5)-methyltransferase
MTRPSRRASARSIACETLNAIDERPVFLKTVLDELCESFGVSGRDRALAFEIAAGVTRRRATVDAVLNAHLRSPDGRIEPRLRTILRMGAYQLLFLAIPPHAAVYEMVELARQQQPRWARFANGVLRSVQRELTDETVDAPRPDAFPVCTLVDQPTSTHAATQVAIEYRRLQAAVFPSPTNDLSAYVAAAFSLPDWLAARWQQRYGETELLRLSAWFATPGRTSLRVNRLRATPDDVLQQLESAGMSVRPGDQDGSIRLLSHARVDHLSGFAAGHFSVQDESAQAVAELLDPLPGHQVLDLCAAPGGKSAALAERMRNEGRIIAADADAARVSLIARGAERLGLTIIEPLVIRPDSSDVPPGPFDRILLDVPCSNTGVLGKRPEARWRISTAGIGELITTQTGLLIAALGRLAIGGQLVYSTCSIEPDENEELVRNVLRDRSAFHLIRELHHQPGLPVDGGYQVLIRREST